jgi:type II secretory pathway component PulK
MRRSSRRCGFVTTLAVMMIALVAVALAALTTRVGTAARQATAAREQAQVELLIQAGDQIAARHGTGDFKQEVALPAELSEAGAKLTVSVRGKKVEVAAQYGRAKMVQN